VEQGDQDREGQVAQEDQRDHIGSLHDDESLIWGERTPHRADAVGLSDRDGVILDDDGAG